MHKNKNTQNSHSFLALAFLGAFVEVGTNEFEISIKFCVFLIPILIFFKKNFFGSY
jgi:hypothetical protein